MRTAVARNSDLLVSAALAAIACGLTAWHPAPLNSIRTSISLLVVLLVPGYCLTIALFPRRDHIEGLERLAVAAGLSIVLVVLAGLLSSLTRWGFEPLPTVVATLIATALGAGLALVRRELAPAEARFTLWSDQQFTRALVLSVGSVALVVVTAVALRPHDHYTALYLLGDTGGFSRYPHDVAPDSVFTVHVVVENHEGHGMRYSLRSPLAEADVTLPRLRNAGTWKGTILVRAPSTNGSATVPVDLYRRGRSKPYRTASLQIDVASAATRPGP